MSDCKCGGRVHEIVNNCIKCGLIKCSKSFGNNICTFCGSKVYPKDYIEDDPFFQELKTTEKDFYQLQEAINHKNKLINFEEQNIANKNIIDDEADWYEIKHNIWQNKEVRKEAINQLINIENEKEETKNEIQIGFDMGKGETVMKDITLERNTKKEVNDYLNNLDTSNKNNNYLENKNFSDKDEKFIKNLKSKLNINKKENIKENLKKIEKELYYDIEFKNLVINKEKEVKLPIIPNPTPVYCMSMWQPWASLVIMGLKKFEGRSWKTDYVGPLWIHAGSKKPTDEEIKRVENEYIQLFGHLEIPKFPTKYPTGCLIGMVDCKGMIDQKIYKEKIEERYTRESKSDNIFLFTNPKKLIVETLVRGNKGVFKLDQDTVDAARKNLRIVNISYMEDQTLKIDPIIDNKELYKNVKSLVPEKDNNKNNKLNKDDSEILFKELLLVENNNLNILDIEKIHKNKNILNELKNCLGNKQMQKIGIENSKALSIKEFVNIPKEIDSLFKYISEKYKNEFNFNQIQLINLEYKKFDNFKLPSCYFYIILGDEIIWNDKDDSKIILKNNNLLFLKNNKYSLYFDKFQIEWTKKKKKYAKSHIICFLSCN